MGEEHVTMFQEVTMREIQRAYDQAAPGGSWFAPGEMRSFRTTLPANGYRSHDGLWYYFATGERPPSLPGQPARRRYSVRCLYVPEGRIDTMGRFLGFDTLKAAKAMAKRLANGDMVAMAAMELKAGRPIAEVAS